MSDKTDAQATFAVNLEGNVAEKSAEDVSALEDLRASLQRGQDAVRQMSAQQRALRGSSDEVKDAREKLKALLDAEKNALSAATVALLKQGTSYEKLTQDSKRLAAEKEKLTSAEKQLQEKMKAKGLEDAKKQSEALGKAIHVAGGPVEELASRFDTLKGILGTGAGAIAGVTLVAAGAVAALVAMTAAAVSLGVSFTKWIIAGADAARSMNILRLATTKTAENARNLGTQVDDLASKLSTPKEDLNKLAASLGRTRLSGQAIVDTFNAVGRASDAMGDDVGATLKDIITRGQQFNRFQLNPLELQGKGLKFDDVAGELAKNMKVGIGDARAALFEGRVSIDQGAKALRQAVEKNFASINAAKLLSIDVQVQKFHEDLRGLASGVNLEPLLRWFAELRGLFSQSTVMGATLKSAITTIGNALGPAFTAALPILKGFFKGAVIGALDVGIAFLKLGKTASKLFGEDFKGIDGVKAAEIPFKVLAGAVDLLRVALIAVDIPLHQVMASIGLVGRANAAMVGGVQDLAKDLGKLTGLGRDTATGLAAGMNQGAPGAGDASRELAQKVQSEFTDKLKIHSPSKVFLEYGQNTAEGYEQGVRSGASGAADATNALGSAPPRGGSADSARAPSSRGDMSSAAPPAKSGGGAGAGNVTVRVEAGAIVVQVQGGDGRAIAKELGAGDFVGQLTKTLRDALKGAGIPTQVVPVP